MTSSPWPTRRPSSGSPVGLAKILPGVPMVGEEAVETEPDLVDLIARPGETCWIVDPLDGTANFAAGKDVFAMIVCLVHDRAAVGGWILDVPRGHMAVALKGQGVSLDGKPVRREKPARPPIGFVGYKVRKEFDRQLPPDRRRTLGRVSTLRCAGAEYLEILAGRADFNLYRMTKPWDHAAGALMVEEAGGEAQRFDRRALRAGPADQRRTDHGHPSADPVRRAHAVRRSAHAAAGGAAEGLAQVAPTGLDTAVIPSEARDL